VSAESINYRLLGVSKTEPDYFVVSRGRQFWYRGHLASFTLPGKSRTITVEPVEVPDRTPAERPAEAPVPEPERHPAPAEPGKRREKKPEKVPG
jgi:hypothetical protein